MDAFLNEPKERKTNYKGYVLGAIIGLIAISAIIFIAARRPSMEDQEAAVLEGAFTEGSPEFDAITKDIIISTDDDTVESPMAFGTVSMFIHGRIRNKGTKTLNALEINVSVVTQFNQVLKEKRLLVVPTQVPRLGPGEIIPVSLSLDNFAKDDDRAAIRWKVTAIRVEN